MCSMRMGLCLGKRASPQGGLREPDADDSSALHRQESGIQREPHQVCKYQISRAFMRAADQRPPEPFDPALRVFILKLPGQIAAL